MSRLEPNFQTEEPIFRFSKMGDQKPNLGNNQPDSTCPNPEAGLLENIEKIIDKKFKILENRIGLLQKKHDDFYLSEYSN